jgi:methionine synthase reductase
LRFKFDKNSILMLRSGLGDSNYSKFNRPAKDLDAMLASRGARCFLPLTLADDATGLEQVVDPWIESVLPAVQSQLKAIESNPIPTKVQNAEVQAVPATPSESTITTPTPVLAKLDMSVIKKPFRPAALRACASKLTWLTTVDSTTAIQSKTANGASAELWWRWSRLESAANAANTTEAVEHSLRGCTHDTPFLVPLLFRFTTRFWLVVIKFLILSQAGVSGAKILTGEGSEKHVLHLELSLPQATTSKNSFVASVNQSIGALHYAPGDAIGIHCPNDPHVVSSLLQRLQVTEQADCVCAVSDSQLPVSFTPRQALTYVVDINVQMYKKAFLRALAEHCSDANEKEMLSFLSSREGVELYNSEIIELSLLQLLCKFPSCQPPLAFILSELPALQVRAVLCFSYDLIVFSIRLLCSASILLGIECTLASSVACARRYEFGASHHC